MAASNFPITQAAVPTHFNRGEKTGTDIGTGKDIIAQVVLAGVHKRAYLGTQTLVLSSSAQSLTVPAGSPFVLAEIYNESTTNPATDFARYWHGGSVPTASAGKRLFNDQELPSADPATLQGINGSGTNTWRIEYYTNG